MSTCFTEPTCLEKNIGSDILTLVDLLTYRAETQPNQVVYTFLKDGESETQQFTYEALHRQARLIAARLQSLDAFGTRALLLYPPGLEFIAAFFGCLYAGVIAVPAYPPRHNQKMSRLQAIVTSSEASFALTTAALLHDIRNRFAEQPELARLQWLTTDSMNGEENDEENGEENVGDSSIKPDLAIDWRMPDLTDSTLAFLQYTSGSTGSPKGVMISHGNLMHNSALIQQAFGDTAQSQGVTWLPPYHDMGLIGGIIQPLYVGASMVVMPPVMFLQKPLRWLQAISRYRVTTTGGPNFAFDLCVRKATPEQLNTLDLSSWQVAFTGAEPVRAETLEQFAATFAPCGFRREAFRPCYGMAETTLIVSGSVKAAVAEKSAPIVQQVDAEALEQNQIKPATGDQDNRRTIVGCGQSANDLKVVIVNPETLTVCTAAQVGEIWVSGASVAQGYWNQPDLTKQTFQAYLPETGEGPFLRTGDLGFLQDGELFITGRIKDLMIMRGQNHYPQDVELTVEKSHPAMRPGCGAAFTVEVKGEERLVVVQEVERSYLRKLNVKEVVSQMCRAVTAEHGLQTYATILVKTGTIPKTSSGKIQRHACRSQYLAGKLNVIEDWSENPQGKAKFLHLQAEVDLLLQELSASKQA